MGLNVYVAISILNSNFFLVSLLFYLMNKEAALSRRTGIVATATATAIRGSFLRKQGWVVHALAFSLASALKRWFATCMWPAISYSTPYPRFSMICPLYLGQ